MALPEKVAISRILIQRAAGLSSRARVSTVEAANAVLASWSKEAHDVSHDPCEVHIVFEDGFRYHGHYDLKKSPKNVSLSRHVRQQLAALAATTGAAATSPTVDAPVISLIGTTSADSARIALGYYNISRRLISGSGYRRTGGRPLPPFEVGPPSSALGGQIEQSVTDQRAPARSDRPCQEESQ